MKRALVLLAFACASVRAFAATNNDINAENVLALMNDYRAEQHLPPLRLDTTLNAVAADRMRDMEDTEYWSHESPDGTSPFVWLTVEHYPYRFAGENLANGFETAHLLVDSWMESPGHRENILSTDFDECGIAIIDGSTKGPATGKSIVVMFGRRR
ncbi:MAG: CAP domain-containing protein [Acidobacteria bacterium]|nr:CAP domain-containing protein [Acidobacteriota bacterium]MBV9475874.1 CAP domain-containing protein [Acidobacteriota bacterium]